MLSSTNETFLGWVGGSGGVAVGVAVRIAGVDRALNRVFKADTFEVCCCGCDCCCGCGCGLIDGIVKSIGSDEPDETVDNFIFDIRDVGGAVETKEDEDGLAGCRGTTELTELTEVARGGGILADGVPGGGGGISRAISISLSRIFSSIVRSTTSGGSATSVIVGISSSGTGFSDFGLYSSARRVTSSSIVDIRFVCR